MLLRTISLILLSAVSSAEPDYCDPVWCPSQGIHIACNNTGAFGEECVGEYWLEDLEPYKELIVHLHNELRNILALGQVPPYEPAVRMPSLRWDESLCKMAELNAKTCHFEHDGCRSTVEFPYSGQNIYYAQTTWTNFTIVDFIKEAFELWFLEHKDANMDIINSFNLTIPQSGHFTALMLDRNDRVGCGYLYSIRQRRRRKPLIRIIFTCNYPSTNILLIPTYLSGPSASFCTRPHQVYRGLCHEDEVIDPNDFTWYFE